MVSQTDRPHVRSKSNPIYSEQQETTKDVQSQEEDGKRVEGIKTELDFADWYNELEDGLLEAGYEEYQYAALLIPIVARHWLTCVAEQVMSR